MRVDQRFVLCCFFCFIFWYSGLAAAAETEVMTPFRVGTGTNLIHIAKEYCNSPDDWKIIARINKLGAPYVIYAEREIEVPQSLLKMENLSLQVVTVNGEAILQKRTGEQVALAPKSKVSPGETVITGENAYVQLLFPNGMYSRLDSDSSMTLSYLFTLVDGHIKAEAFLNKGKVINKLNKKLRFNDSMRTRTPEVITGIRGTEYRVKTLDGRMTTVETIRGRVAVQGKDRNIALAADQGITAQKNGSLGKTQTLPQPPITPRLERVYRSLPVHLHIPASLNDGTMNIRLSSDEEGLATIYENSAPAGKDVIVREVADGRYYAFFSVTDKQGFESRENGPLPFIVRTAPPAPFLSSPQNESILWGKRAELAWLGSQEAVGYRAQLSQYADFHKIIETRELEDTAYTSPEIAPGTYFFRVQALAQDGFASNFSSTLTWEQRDVPAMRGMESSAGKKPVLQWGPMGEGWHYDFQAARDKDFSTLIADGQGLADASYSFPEKLDAGKYYIRLRGYAEGQEPTPWTPTQTMIVKNHKPLQGGIIGAILLGVILL